MNIIYARQLLPQVKRGQSIPNSIFLVGPTPRDEKTESWRPEAIKFLKENGFAGTLFVPEDDGWVTGDDFHYDSQVWWEIAALGMSAAICCWIPREMQHMPAFTSNVEFGFCLALRSNLLVLGHPKGAPKMKYLSELAENNKRFADAFGIDVKVESVPVFHTIEESLRTAMVIAQR